MSVEFWNEAFKKPELTFENINWVFGSLENKVTKNVDNDTPLFYGSMKELTAKANYYQENTDFWSGVCGILDNCLLKAL